MADWLIIESIAMQGTQKKPEPGTYKSLYVYDYYVDLLCDHEVGSCVELAEV